MTEPEIGRTNRAIVLVWSSVDLTGEEAPDAGADGVAIPSVVGEGDEDGDGAGFAVVMEVSVKPDCPLTGWPSSLVTR